MSRRPVIPVRSGFTETPPWQRWGTAMSGSARWGRSSQGGAGDSLTSAGLCLRDSSELPASPADHRVKFSCAPKSPVHRQVPAGGAGTCAPASSRRCACPGIALTALLLLPLMKSSPLLLLLSFPAPSECHGLSAAHQHAFLLVSSGTSFLLADFSPSAQAGPPFVVWSWSRFLSGDQLAGKCLLLVIPSFAFVHAASSTG